MNTSTNVVRLRRPDEIDDPLTDVLRAGARRLLVQAAELGAEAFLAAMRGVGGGGGGWWVVGVGLVWVLWGGLAGVGGEAFLAAMRELRLPDGRDRLVR